MSNTPTRLDISIRPNPRTEIRIDGDDGRVIALDLQDYNIVNRFAALLPELDAIDAEYTAAIKDKSDDQEGLQAIVAATRDLEARLTAAIDTLFDADVCAICSGGASLFTPVGGTLLYELIISQLASLYDDAFTTAVKQRRARVAKHTAKYQVRK